MPQALKSKPTKGAQRGRKPPASPGASPAPEAAPPKPRPVIQRRDEKEDVFFAQASFNLGMRDSSETGITYELKTAVSLFRFVRESPAGTISQTLKAQPVLARFLVEDRSGTFKDQTQYDSEEIDGKRRDILQSLGLADETDSVFRNSYRAARAIEEGINGALLHLNEANVSNARRSVLAKRIMKRFAEALISYHGGKIFLRARGYKGVLKRIEAEQQGALEMIRAADFGGVKVSVPLQNSMIDAAELSSTHPEKTAAYKSAIRKVRDTHEGLTDKADSCIIQLKLFEEEITYKVANSLLHQARGNAIALVLKIMEIRQQAQAFARARGIDQTSTRAVDMYTLGFEYVCYFPAGLNQKRFTIAANDVLRALELPYSGKEGTRERRRAEADLFHFAALEYVQEPTKSNKDRVLVHSFSMKASTKGERTNAVRFWAFDNFSDEFLIPARHQYSRLEVGFLAYVYKHFTGSREKAGGIIKFMTAAHAKLMKEERRRAAAGEPVTGKIEVKVRFDENHWPNFRTKEENSEAKRIMKEAFAQANMIATYEERAFSMTLAGFFTMEGAPQQVESAPAPAPGSIPQGGRKVKKG